MHAELNCVHGQLYCYRFYRSLVQPNYFFRGLRIVLTQIRLTTTPCSVPPRAAMNSDVEALAALDLDDIPEVLVMHLCICSKTHSSPIAMCPWHDTPKVLAEERVPLQ